MAALYRIFAYLDQHHNSQLVFDLCYPVVNERDFIKYNWSKIYGDMKESIPPNAPEPRGREVELKMFVDTDHAGDQRNRRLRSGFIIYVNLAPIIWMLKKQATVETSVFGAEFVAMKLGMETLCGLRYKLRMMGVPIAGLSSVYGDNMSVINNTQRPKSTLKKKSNLVCYHAVRESVAMREMRTAQIPSSNNRADICTKIIPSGQKRQDLMRKVMYDIHDGSDSFPNEG